MAGPFSKLFGLDEIVAQLSAMDAKLDRLLANQGTDVSPQIRQAANALDEQTKVLRDATPKKGS